MMLFICRLFSLTLIDGIKNIISQELLMSIGKFFQPSLVKKLNDIQPKTTAFSIEKWFLAPNFAAPEAVFLR